MGSPRDSRKRIDWWVALVSGGFIASLTAILLIDLTVFINRPSTSFLFRIDPVELIVNATSNILFLLIGTLIFRDRQRLIRVSLISTIVSLVFLICLALRPVALFPVLDAVRFTAMLLTIPFSVGFLPLLILEKKVHSV